MFLSCVRHLHWLAEYFLISAGALDTNRLVPQNLDHYKFAVNLVLSIPSKKTIIFKSGKNCKFKQFMVFELQQKKKLKLFQQTFYSVNIEFRKNVKLKCL